MSELNLVDTLTASGLQRWLRASVKYAPLAEWFRGFNSDRLWVMKPDEWKECFAEDPRCAELSALVDDLYREAAAVNPSLSGMNRSIQQSRSLRAQIDEGGAIDWKGFHNVMDATDRTAVILYALIQLPNAKGDFIALQLWPEEFKRNRAKWLLLAISFLELLDKRVPDRLADLVGDNTLFDLAVQATRAFGSQCGTKLYQTLVTADCGLWSERAVHDVVRRDFIDHVTPIGEWLHTTRDSHKFLKAVGYCSLKIGLAPLEMVMAGVPCFPVVSKFLAYDLLEKEYPRLTRAAFAAVAISMFTSTSSERSWGPLVRGNFDLFCSVASVIHPDVWTEQYRGCIWSSRWWFPDVTLQEITAAFAKAREAYVDAVPGNNKALARVVASFVV